MIYLSFSVVLSLLAAFDGVSALPIPSSGRAHTKREVPQEHSHQKIVSSTRTSLILNNPLQIVDPVFGLLGNAAAVGGVPGGNVDPECLQQIIADQAFTNAKAAKDVDGMVAALQFRALERNTGKVGLRSNPCTSVKAVNPEIAAIQQHQDPASTGAAAANKAVVLALAKQIAAVGGDPQLALETGTFAPGNLNDNTAKGNTCDDANDPVGCIFTQNLLVADATADEIDAASGSSGKGAGAPAATTTTAAAKPKGTKKPAPAKTTTTTAAASAPTTSAGEFGTCPAPLIEGGLGFDGRTEFSFEPENRVAFNHGSAQNIGIITQFVCDNLVNQCGLKSDSPGLLLCRKGQAAVGNGKNDGGLADKFNAFFGAKTNFAKAPGSTSSSGAVVPNPAPAKTTTTTAAASAPTTGAGEFGTCPAPLIEGGLGFDGRTEFSFEPENRVAFNHGSAQNIGIITQFVCDNLVNQCGLKSDSPGLLLCRKAQAAVGSGKNDGGLADKFNAFFGAKTNFAKVPGSVSSSGAVVATTTAAAAGAAKTTTTVAAAAPTNAAGPTAGNLQKFNQGLGGILPPAVTPSGQQFQVEGNDSFNTLSAALGRSCDVQHNKCANAANSGNTSITGSVGGCDAQNTQCHSANGI